MNTKPLIIVMLALFLSSQYACKPAGIIGKYKAAHNFALVNTTLEIKKDHSFIGRSKVEGRVFTAAGSWVLRKDTLMLSPTPGEDIVTVSSVSDPQAGDLQIAVKYESDKTDIPVSGIVLNGSYINKKDDSVFRAAMQPITELKVDYMDSQFPIPVAGIRGNKVTIFFNFEKSRMRYGIAQMWRVKRGKLKAIGSTEVFFKVANAQ